MLFHYPEKAAGLSTRAARRKAAVLRYFWDPSNGIYADYLWREGN